MLEVEIVFPKGLLRLLGARIEQIFSKKFAYPLERLFQRTTKTINFHLLKSPQVFQVPLLNLAEILLLYFLLTLLL